MPGALVERGDRVTLRTVEEEDVPFLQRVFANPELRVPAGSMFADKSRAATADRLEQADNYLVCLDDGEPGQPGEDCQPIGVVNVDDAGWKRPELTYWLVPEVHGQGYGTESVSLAIDYVFETYDHPSVGAGAYDFNDPSRGLLESLGFTQEGRRRKTRFIDGEYRDLVEYGLLRGEWYDGV
jgi:ribosomal-protein-alanine N-acetyltransferase